ALIDGLRGVAVELPVVLPLHPRTRAALMRQELLDSSERLHLLEPLGYLDMLALEKHARLIATDSGGVQKEAFFFGVPCVTLRDETEWMEWVELGWIRLLPPVDAASVSDGIRAALAAPHAPAPPPVYGGGTAAESIATILAAQSRQAGTCPVGVPI